MNRSSIVLAVITSQLYFIAMLFLISLINSTIGLFGLFLFVPTLFLLIPAPISPQIGKIMIFMNGLLLDCYSSAPLGLIAFIMLFFSFFIFENFGATKEIKILDAKVLLISTNIFIHTLLFLLSHNEVLLNSNWSAYKFFADLVLSCIVIFGMGNLCFLLHKHLLKIICQFSIRSDKSNS